MGSVAGTGVTAAAATEGAANFQALEAMLTYLHESSAGLVTNSILFCRLFTIKDRCKKVRSQQTHNQGLRPMLFTVSWDLHA